MLFDLPDGLYPFIDQRLPLSDLTMIEMPADLERLLRTQAEACQSARKVDPLSASNVDPHVDDQHLDRPALAGVAEGEPGAGDGALRL
jgi:hypothetical protein